MVVDDLKLSSQKEKASHSLMDSLIASSKSGVIRTSDVTTAGLHRSILSEYVNDGILSYVSRGIYIRTDVWEDDWLLLQLRYKKVVFSHDTALYLHGFSDRIPLQSTVTVPRSYHSVSLSEENVIVRKAEPHLYELGISEIPSPSGNLIRAYDLERTLCDMLRGSNPDMELLAPAFQRYAVSKRLNIPALHDYAKQLHVLTKIRHYMEILL